MSPLFYNTLTRTKEVFKPLKNKMAGLYTCGPTVYNYVHIGNLRTYIFEDVLKRVLIYNGYNVNHVMNITDVGHLTDDADEGEDKMEKGAKREGKTAWEIAEFYTKAFKKDLNELNILEPDIWCKATDHIKEQIILIEDLEKKGFTYRTNDGVYFDTSKLSDYGKLAGLKKAALKTGARVQMGDKKNSTDFALWKLSPQDKKRQMEWESPWGIGFPGWHIECSAMATKYLGQPFDIHCGGIDHIPVHHTNEIAQSEAAYNKTLANYWLHGEFLLINKDKMAKSGDNFITLETIKQKGFSPLAYRYFVLQTHYRQQLNFSWEALEAAQKGLNNLYKHVRELKELLPEGKINKQNEQKTETNIQKYLNDDLGTPQTLAFIQNAIKKSEISYNKLLEIDEKILGLNLKKESNEHRQKIHETITDLRVQELKQERNLARINKDFQKSDEIRKKLEDLGYEVKDTKNGTKIIKK